MSKNLEISLCFFDKRDLSFMSRTAITSNFKMRWFPHEGRCWAGLKWEEVWLDPKLDSLSAQWYLKCGNSTRMLKIVFQMFSKIWINHGVYSWINLHCYYTKQHHFINSYRAASSYNLTSPPMTLISQLRDDQRQKFYQVMESWQRQSPICFKLCSAFPCFF